MTAFWTNLAQIITALGVLATIWMRWHDAKKLQEIKEQTNGMSHHMNALAQQVGVKIGEDSQRATNTEVKEAPKAQTAEIIAAIPDAKTK